MEAIRKTGIMIGDGKGSFNPDATATRAEIAAIASRLIGYIYEKRLEQGNVMLTIDSETVPEEKAFSALITEKFDAEGFFDSVNIQNYDDIKDTLEDFAGGETTKMILNAVFTKCDMIIPVSYTVNV